MSYSGPQSYAVDTAITPLDPVVTGTLECSLVAKGFDSVDKVYLVYYVGNGCGPGARPTLHGYVVKT